MSLRCLHFDFRLHPQFKVSQCRLQTSHTDKLQHILPQVSTKLLLAEWAPACHLRSWTYLKNLLERKLYLWDSSIYYLCFLDTVLFQRMHSKLISYKSFSTNDWFDIIWILWNQRLFCFCSYFNFCWFLYSSFLDLLVSIKVSINIFMRYKHRDEVPKPTGYFSFWDV